MGLRHIIGILNSNNVKKLSVYDISKDSLENVSKQLQSFLNKNIVSFYHIDQLYEDKLNYNIAILSNTASNRQTLLEFVIQKGIKNILVEKPLGQSLKEVENLISYIKKFTKVRCDVNLNMRLYEGFNLLKYDLDNLPQLQGPKTIMINTGSIGIGANGIHYIDLAMFLLNASNYTIDFADIDETVLTSGRGKEFCDFGGIVVAKFANSVGELVGKLILSISSKSTAFGNWEIIATHGKISINEFLGQRVNHYRNKESEMPINRYLADYLEPEIMNFNVTGLSQITTNWLNELDKNNFILPSLEESFLAHKFMFDWLSKSKSFIDKYPIT